ncbi:Eco57I restriction-modification methylase domain-containing protein [Methanocrinis sp.]|uniref:Eco57I restriction-modification methylase domain-containing protein n=1 Tax=Methanocrinis sp. TaxID=3101522 RepID=UPI003D1003D1
MSQSPVFRNNHNLFSNYYLDERVKQNDEWREDEGLGEAFKEIKKLFQKRIKIFQNCSEAMLEDSLIRPIFRILDHHFGIQESVYRGAYRPDYSFFADPDSLAEAYDRRESDDFYLRAVAIGDAKAWNVSLDKTQKRVGGFNIQNPSYQIDIYLRNTPPEWAILTNGGRWRLYHQDTSYRLDSYYEIDLLNLIERGSPEEFKYFYLFFRREAFLPGRDGRSFLDRVKEGSVAYTRKVGDDLQENVYRAMKVLAEGFLRSRSEGLSPAESGHLVEEIRENALRLLYRLLFIFYAESRDLLNVENEHYRQLSLQRLKMEVAEKLDGREPLLPISTAFWDRLSNLFRLINEGSEKLGIPREEFYIPPYNGGLFDPEKNPFLTERRIGDRFVAEAVDLLARSDGGERKVFVDYSSLEIRHLGSIYEGLLEYRLRAAEEEMVAVSEKGAERWVPAREAGGEEGEGGRGDERSRGGRAREKAKASDRVSPGGVYLVTDKGERKATGSYYTPDSLVKHLVESAIDPLIRPKIEECMMGSGEGEEFVDYILSLKVIDPSMGSGHFLVEATDHLARYLIQAKMTAAPEGEDEEEVAEHDIQWARREVVRNCIYGVDLNPMAVELAKLSLWLTTVASNKPLSFLDHHLKCGNSLIGAELGPEMKGVLLLPAARGRGGSGGRRARGGGASGQRETKGSPDASQSARWMQFVLRRHGEIYNEKISGLTARADDDLETVKWKEEEYRRLRGSEHTRRLEELANVWLSTYFGNEVDEEEYADLQHRLSEEASPDWSSIRRLEWFEKAQNLAEKVRFFHWELEFPEVFFGEGRGFDVVLGNPPWERIKLQEKEFFASRDPEIAKAPTAAARRKLIGRLPETNPALAAEYEAALQQSQDESNFIRNSGRYPLTGVGDVNVYAVFAELAQSLVKSKGRAGIIVPSGIATDYTYRNFFQDLVDRQSLVSLFDFENREKLFPDVDSRMKFTLLTTTGGAQFPLADFAFFLHNMKDLADEKRHFTLTREDLNLINPNTLTCPIFRTKTDAEITRKIYLTAPVMANEKTETNSWNVRFATIFHMANDSYRFRKAEDLIANSFKLKGNVFIKNSDINLPLYEAKMFMPYDHRAANVVEDNSRLFRPGQPDVTSIEEHTNPEFVVVPRYWVSKDEVINNVPDDTSRSWLFGYKNVTSSTNERTFLGTILPFVAAGHSIQFIFSNRRSIEKCALVANLNTFIFDFVARQKLGGNNFSYFILKQLPVIPPDRYTPELLDFIVPRVVELTYTAWDLLPFAEDVLKEVGEETWSRWFPDNPPDGEGKPAPFLWDEERRAALRADLDGLYAHLYQLDREDLHQILDTFPIVKRKDEARYGEFRTKRLVLEAFDRLASLG